MPNITKLTEEYINHHPSIKDAVKKGLINYYALTRLICKDAALDVKNNFDAVLIACRRYHKKIKDYKVLGDRIIQILRNSKLEVKTKIMVVVTEKNIYFNNLLDLQKDIKKKAEIFHVIEGSNTITLITSQEFKAEIEKLFKNKIIKITDGLAEVVMKHPEDMEDTPGVISYLTTLLAEKGINIVETMSCWTDTLFVVSEQDIAIVLDALNI